ncbi:class I SAM-dependent methyltransferase [Paractinoplanes rishiriensis]|uniref:Methyltransferase type 11 n=1 Tax=Paractinoplanes rishiriensis TaxID=1050105 RepID=A0A919K3V8_9ACTN|nr:class I SAM-dependent methyltransferase [Actinoplanes rishiriensis]GIE98088.1 methyltransferase type 11 [Actinoplanes rishiriensis]
MTGQPLGRIFNEVPELYDRVRPGYPDALFDDLATSTGLDEQSTVLEVGCGTGQATRSLATLGCAITALEPGPDMADLARARLATFPKVKIKTTKFEQWYATRQRFDLVVAASSWHWVDPSTGWQHAHDLLRPGGSLALLGYTVVRRPDLPEVYAETADLHEHFVPGNPDWGHPPLEHDARTEAGEWSPLFEPPAVHWYPTVQWFDGQGYADLMRSTSMYRKLPPDVREPLLDAVADRIRTRLDDRASRCYLTFLRVARRTA